MVILAFGAITFFYAMPLLPKQFVNNQQNLRNIGGIKVYLIALVWSGVTVILPIINNHYSWSSDMLLTALQRFVYIIVLMIPFEIRDLRYDSVKLATIPQMIGIMWTKIMGVILLLVFFLIIFFKVRTDQEEIIISSIIALVTALFVLGSKEDQGKYYSSFFVEGLPILWFLLALLIS